MTTAVIQPTAVAAEVAPKTFAGRRRTIDGVLVGFGVLVTIVLAVAGAMLTWGSNFASDYVHDELSSQHIAFPAAEALTAEGRTDLLNFAGRTVDTGSEAEGYASYINGHLNGIAGGATYADLGGPERAAKADVQTAVDAGKADTAVTELQAKADAITNQRNTLFKGETLRGLLLSAYAWSTVGSIAGIAGTVAFAAAMVMMVLVILGLVHLVRTPKPA